MTSVPLDETVPADGPATSLATRLYHGTTTFDFVGKRRYGFYLSLVAVIISIASLFGRGLNLGIDFKGGVAWEFNAKGLSIGKAEDILGKFALRDGAKVQSLNAASGERIRVQVGPLDTAKQNEVRAAFAEATGATLESVDLTSVSPSWGDEITNKAVRALIFFFIALTIYISLRFEWKMAIAAFVAVVHDVLISVGIYSVFGFEVAPATVIAFLTILGYSLYDTIVVFDKVHENTKKLQTSGKATYGDIVNLSMNQVLMRSLNTSLAAVLPVLSLLVIGSWAMGARALQDFALALFVGLVTGSYSSIYIATPILAALKEREPRYRAIAAKLGGHHDVAAVRSLSGSGSSTRVTAAAGPVDATISPAITKVTGSVPPRPRKKRKR